MGGPVDKNAAHAERDQVLDALKTAFAQGRLTKEELELRVGQALAIYRDLDALTADIPVPSRRSESAANVASEQARQLHNKKIMRRGTAVGSAISMTATATLAIPAVPRVFLTIVVGFVMAVLLAGAQKLLWRVFERTSRAHAAPPDAGDQALGYLTSADTDPGGQVTDGQTTETSRRRLSSSARVSYQLATG